MVTHLTPDASGRCRCCGKLTCELPLSDGFTTDEGKKDCPHTGYVRVKLSGDWPPLRYTTPSPATIKAILGDEADGDSKQTYRIERIVDG